MESETILPTTTTTTRQGEHAVSDKERNAQLRAVVKSYKQITPKEIKSRGPEDILGAEDQAVGTDLEYLFRLNDCVAAAPDGVRQQFTNPLWKKRVQYLESFDAVAVRYAGAAFRELVENIYGDASKADAPHMAILPIRNALIRLDPSGETFTSLHLPYLRVCLETALYHEALPILDRPIYHYPSSSTSTTSPYAPYLCSPGRESSTYITAATELTAPIHHRHVQEYYLLGGMIYMALGRARWEDARLCFEMVLTSPTQNVATGLMLEAYRKWILMGLLLDGKTSESVRGLGPGAFRVLQTATKPYHALRTAFDQPDVAKLKAEVDVGLKTWDEDGNLGLVLQLTAAHQRHFILRLQNHYVSYQISKLDQDVNRAIDILNNLISSGDLDAIIDTTSSSEPVVRFSQSSSSSSSTSGPSSLSNMSESQIQSLLLQQMARNKKLAEAVSTADSRVILSYDFVQAARRARESAAEVEAELREEAMFSEGPATVVPTSLGPASGLGGAGGTGARGMSAAGGDGTNGVAGNAPPGAWVTDVADEDLMET